MPVSTPALKRFLIVGLGFLPALVFARIGETTEECEKRYGKPEHPVFQDPKTPDLSFAIYRKGQLEILIVFLNGKAGSILYSPSNTNTVEALTPESVEVLLKANIGDVPWSHSQDPTNENVQHFETTNGTFTASYDAGKNTLTIENKDMLEHTKNIRRMKAAGKLKGF